MSATPKTDAAAFSVCPYTTGGRVIATKVVMAGVCEKMEIENLKLIDALTICNRLAVAAMNRLANGESLLDLRDRFDAIAENSKNAIELAKDGKQ